MPLGQNVMTTPVWASNKGYLAGRQKHSAFGWSKDCEPQRSVVWQGAGQVRSGPEVLKVVKTFHGTPLSLEFLDAMLMLVKFYVKANPTTQRCEGGTKSQATSAGSVAS